MIKQFFLAVEVKNNVALRDTDALGNFCQRGLRQPELVDAIHGCIDKLALAKLALVLAIAAREILCGYLYGHVNSVPDGQRILRITECIVNRYRYIIEIYCKKIKYKYNALIFMQAYAPTGETA